MRRREELFLQGVNLELSAFSKFWRVWPCRRKMSDVDLGTHKRTWRFTKRLTLQYVNALTDFLALVKISARVLPKHRTDWTSTEGLCLPGRGRGPMRLCALTTRCAKRFENTGRYPNSTDLCAAPQYYLTELWSGRNLGKWLIPCAPLWPYSLSLHCHSISQSSGAPWASGARNMVSVEQNALLETQKLLLTSGIWASSYGKWDAEESGGVWLWVGSR